ncbi:MAG: FxLYD domain-containing protein [Acidobacteriota bacterium]
MAYYNVMRSGHHHASPAPAKSRCIRNTLAALAIAFTIATLAGCSSKPPGELVPTPEEKAYLQNIQVTPGRVEAAQNFLGHTVTTLHGTVSNKGNKTVVYLEVKLTFMSIDGKPLEDKSAYPVSGNTLPLKPGQTEPFKVSFDEVPAAWNQAPPKITLVRVLLAG